MPLYNEENQTKRKSLMADSENQRFLEEGRLEVKDRLARSSLFNPESFTKDLTDDDYIKFGKERIDKQATSWGMAIPRAVGTIPLRVGEAVGGVVQRVGESWEKERQEIKDAIGLVQREGAPIPQPERKMPPIEAGKGFSTFLRSLAGRGVKEVGRGVRAIRETAPVRFAKEHIAKSRLDEARIYKEVSPEVAELFKKGDEESLVKASQLLQSEKQFAQKSFAEKVLSKPITEIGEATSKYLRETAEELRPVTEPGTLKYYVSTAIESVGSTMGPALIATLATKKPGIGLSIMFPQVYGQSYSEQRSEGKSVTESTDTALMYAITEVLSEGVPLGIITKQGGKFIPRVLKGATAESIQEVLNEAVQIAYDEGIIGKDTPSEEIGQRLLDAGIIGAIGGTGMGVLSHGVARKETTDKEATAAKKDVMDVITDALKTKEQTPEQALSSMREGYENGLFDKSDLDKVAKQYPNLKQGVTEIVEIAANQQAATNVHDIINEGMSEGNIMGEPFTPDTAFEIINTAYADKIITDEDIDLFKEQYPDLRSGINDIIGKGVGETISQEIQDAERVRREVEEASIEERADREAEERIRVRRVKEDRLETEKREAAKIERKKILERKFEKPEKPIEPVEEKPKEPEIEKPKVAEKEPRIKEVAKPSEILKPEIESKYGRFLEKVGKRLQSEAIGQDILDTLEEGNVLPESVSRTFWEDTFFKLPEGAQNNIKKYLTSLTGMKPGDVMATLKGKGIKAKDWMDIANVVEKDLTKIEHLEGTERGYIALMAYANEQVKIIPAKPITPKPPKPTPPEVVEKEIKAEPMPEVGEVSPRLVEKQKVLEGKIESLKNRIDQAEKTAMPGTFVTGRENVPRSRIRKLEAQLDKRIDSAVEYEKLKKELTQIESQIKSQEEAPKRELVKEKVKAKLEEQFDTIKVGDQIDVGGNNILTVTKKNPKSVITEAGGKWTADEIIKVMPEVAPKPKKEPKVEAPPKIEPVKEEIKYSLIKKDMVDGRTVLKDVPNIDSIAATLTDYDILSGIREIPMKDIEVTAPKDLFYAADDLKKSRELAQKIKENKEISPLIVVQDAEGLYILEGAHRLAALHEIKAKSFPALIVKDLEEVEAPAKITPKVEVIHKKKPKVEAPVEKAPTKPEPGKAWIKGKQRPIMAARLVTRGKNKGKYEITLTRGRDAEGNIIPGVKRVVEEKAIITMPEVAKPAEELIEEAKVRIKASTTEILKGERGSFSTKTKEGAATFEDFSIVGKDFIQRGADTFTKFAEQMEKTFVDVWESVKHLAKEIYTRAKVILTEERGEITIREEKEPKIDYRELIKRYHEESFKKAKTKTDSLGKVSLGKETKRGATDTQKISDSPSSPEGFNMPSEGKGRQLLDTIQWKMQDRLIHLKKVQDVIEKTTELPDSSNVYQTEELYHYKTTKRINDADSDLFDPLVESIAKSKHDLEDVELFLRARHAQEANKRLQEINPNIKDNTALSGMSNVEALKIRKQYMGDIPMYDIAKQIDSITKATRQTLVKDGLATKEEIKTWENAYRYYIPLKREGKGSDLPKKGRGMYVGGKESKMRLTGSEKLKPVNIVANIMAQHESTIIRAEKAKVGRAMLKLAQEHPNKDLWIADAPELKPFLKQRGKDAQQLDEITGLPTALSEVVYGRDILYKFADNVLVTKVDGVEHTVTFNEQNVHANRIARSLKNLGADNSNAVINVLSKVNRVLAMVNTSYNPEFIISNFARDIQTAGYNINDTQAKNVKAKVFKDVGKAWLGIRQGVRGEYTTEWARHYEAFEKSGAQTGWIDYYKNIEAREKTLKKKLAMLEEGNWPTTKRAFKSVFEFIDNENTAVENAIRLSTYKHMKDLGISDAKAASAAKNLTVNFNRRGDAGQALNALYLFFNANVQGSVRLLYAAAKSPTVRKMMLGTVGFAVMLDMLNRSLGGEDDDGENKYDKVPVWVKEHNMVIMRSNGDYFKIPLPWGYNTLHVLGQVIGESVDPNYKKDFSAISSAGRLGGAGLASFNPLGSESSLLQIASPTLADPFIQWAENQNFAGIPLRPEQNPFDVPKPEYQMYFSNARDPSKWAAKQLNDLTGGDATKPGLVDVSPEVFDLFIDMFTGGAGKFLDNTLRLPMTLTEKDVDVRHIPFVRRVYGEPSEFAARTTFYDNMNDIRYAEKSVKHYQNIRDFDGLKKARKDNKVELRFIGRGKGVKKSVDKLRKRQKQIEKTTLTKEIKTKRIENIEQQIRQKIDRFNKQYFEAKHK